jgi:hypothetical protein
MTTLRTVAILFTGRLVIDQGQYQNFKEYFLTPLAGMSCKVDIFVSHCKGYTPEHIQTFTNLYRPLVIVESSEDVIDTSHIRTYYYRKNVMCMYLSRRNVRDKLKATSRSYDLVISSRTDLWFTTPIPFQQFIHPGIYIPRGNDYSGLNDQCAFGSMTDMCMYLSLYDEMSGDIEFLKKVLLDPEVILKTYLERKRAIVRRFSTKYQIRRY